MSLLELLVVKVSSRVDSEILVNDTRPTSCYEFDENVVSSPLKLNLKRRHIATSHVSANDLTATNVEKQSGDKKVKLRPNRRVAYVFSSELIKEVSRLPKIKGRVCDLTLFCFTFVKYIFCIYPCSGSPGSRIDRILQAAESLENITGKEGK